MKHTLIALTAALALTACDKGAARYVVLTSEGTLIANTKPTNARYVTSCQRGWQRSNPLIDYPTKSADGVTKQEAQNACDVAGR